MSFCLYQRHKGKNKLKKKFRYVDKSSGEDYLTLELLLAEIIIFLNGL